MLRSITSRLIPLVLLGALSTMSAVARTVAYSGACANGGNWLVVITIDGDGHVSGREGVDCFGNHWVDHCGVHPAAPAGLPTTSEYFLTNDTGNGWVRCNVNASGDITRMWGQTASGEYWEADERQGNLL